MLDAEPENARAYLGKLFAECQVSSLEQLRRKSKSIIDNVQYKNILRCNDQILKKTIHDLACQIEYDNAANMLKHVSSLEAYTYAAEAFSKIPEYKDAKEQAEKARQKAIEITAQQTQQAIEKKQNKRTNWLMVLGMLIFFIVAVSIGGESPKDRYNKAFRHLRRGTRQEDLLALQGFIDSREYKPSQDYCNILWDKYAPHKMLAAGENQAIFLIDADPYVFGDDLDLQSAVYEWDEHIYNNSYYKHNIWDVSAANNYIAALSEKGIVKVFGDDFEDVGYWYGIMSISAGPDYLVGAKNDGTVLYSEKNPSLSQESLNNIEQWEHIYSVCTGEGYILGLRFDGTLIYEGKDMRGLDTLLQYDDILSITAGKNHIVAIRSDLSVVTAGDNSYGQCNTENWTDIVAVAAGNEHTVGLKSDGTLVAVGNLEGGRCDVQGYTNIKAIAAGNDFTIALTTDDQCIVISETF